MNLKIKTNDNLDDKLFLDVPCPNPKCEHTLHFSLKEAKQGKKFICENCGESIVLNSTPSP